MMSLCIPLATGGGGPLPTDLWQKLGRLLKDAPQSQALGKACGAAVAVRTLGSDLGSLQEHSSPVPGLASLLVARGVQGLPGRPAHLCPGTGMAALSVK